MQQNLSNIKLRNEDKYVIIIKIDVDILLLKYFLTKIILINITSRLFLIQCLINKC